MRTAVVDDERLVADSLLKILHSVDPEGDHKSFLAAAEALSYLRINRVDVVFLDIEMPEMNGLELAKKIKNQEPRANIVFVTGHPEYALDAHGLYVSGFLLKPVGEDQVHKALQNLRHPVRVSSKRIHVQCFGNFEVFVDGSPLNFKRSKTKELFAYLIDRKGTSCTMGELAAVLWEDKPDTTSLRNQLRNLISDLKKTLKNMGIEDVIIKGWNSLAVDCSKLECDFYGFLCADPVSVNSYAGEYMAQYSWAEMTTGLLCLRERDI